MGLISPEFNHEKRNTGEQGKEYKRIISSYISLRQEESGEGIEAYRSRKAESKIYQIITAVE